jgi:hypothetical protein
MNDTGFKLAPEARSPEFIKKNIFDKLPKDKLTSVSVKEISDLIEEFKGQDLNAMSVLMYAAEQGKLEDYLGKLRQHYQENLQYVHPDARRLAAMPGAVRAENFFVRCYTELGILPQKRKI